MPEAQTQPVIGVDITSSSVKMVELRQEPDNKGYVLEHYAIEKLPKDAVSEGGNINDLDAVANTLRSAWQRMGTRTRNVCLALPIDSVMVKRINLPGGTREKELGAQVAVDAMRTGPFDMAEVNLDFAVIGPASDNAADIEVLMVASRKANVEERVAAAQMAGLAVKAVDVETYAAEAAFEQITRQLPEGAGDRCIALVDIGSTVMNVNFLRNGRSISWRDHQIGGAQLTQQIQAAFGMFAEQAEEGKCEGGLPDNYESDVLTPFRDKVAAEIERALQSSFIWSPQEYSEINYVVLAGGCATLVGLDEVVAARTLFATRVANPFFQMELSCSIKPGQLQKDAPALMTACGLAMQRLDLSRINLLPHRATPTVP